MSLLVCGCLLFSGWFVFTILYSDWIFLDLFFFFLLLFIVIIELAWFTLRIASPHFKFHTEERKKRMLLLYSNQHGLRVIIPSCIFFSSFFFSFHLKTSLFFFKSEKQSNNFYICKTKRGGLALANVWWCVQESLPILPRGNTSNVCRVHYRKNKSSSNVAKLLGLTLEGCIISLFQETVSEYLLSVFFFLSFFLFFFF